MHKKRPKFIAVSLIVIVLVIVFGAAGWLRFKQNKTVVTPTDGAASNNENTPTNNNAEQEQKVQGPNNTDNSANEAPRVSIYPNIVDDGVSKGPSKDFYTVSLPSGWSVEEVYEPYNVVKTFNGSKYLISSFISENTSSGFMDQRVQEGISSVSTIKTTLGTDISVLKTPTVLLFGACKPTGDNCYLSFRGDNNLYIHLYKVVPGAQSAVDTTYPPEIINDFESIAKSLSI